MAIDLLSDDAAGSVTAKPNYQGMADLIPPVQVGDRSAHLDVERDNQDQPPSELLTSDEKGKSGQVNQKASDEAPLQGSGSQNEKSLVSDLVELTKPRIVMMILVTTLATSLIGAGGSVNLIELGLLLLGTACVAGSAGAANQLWEREIDSHMTRTASRPLPTQRVSLPVAAGLTLILGVSGTVLLWLISGWRPAISGLATWILYVLIYTPMKTRTQWNTTIGAIAGALPVLIGYTGFGGEFSDVTGWLLVGVLVAWQYPHFMAIAWMYRKQYGDAGFKMTTTEEPTGLSAGWQSVVGSLALLACSLWLCLQPGASMAGVLACFAVTVAIYPMGKASMMFLRNRDDIMARKLLRSSLLVLPAVLLVVTLRVFW